MSVKTLIRTGATFMNRFINPLVPNLNHQFVSRDIDTIPKLFPSQFISKLENSPHLPQNDVETLNRVSSQGFLYPCGLPSLRFFLPDGNDSSPSEPMLLFPKRTYQPSTIRRKGIMGSWLAKQQRVVAESLLGELPRVGQESQHKLCICQ